MYMFWLQLLLGAKYTHDSVGFWSFIPLLFKYSSCHHVSVSLKNIQNEKRPSIILILHRYHKVRLITALNRVRNIFMAVDNSNVFLLELLDLSSAFKNASETFTVWQIQSYNIVTMHLLMIFTHTNQTRPLQINTHSQLTKAYFRLKSIIILSI